MCITATLALFPTLVRALVPLRRMLGAKYVASDNSESIVTTRTLSCRAACCSEPSARGGELQAAQPMPISEEYM
jgi:hypothetical protein